MGVVADNIAVEAVVFVRSAIVAVISGVEAAAVVIIGSASINLSVLNYF